MSIDASFGKIAGMTDAVYKISDWVHLCGNYAGQKDVADALERIIEVFVKEVAALQADHGGGE